MSYVDRKIEYFDEAGKSIKLDSINSDSYCARGVCYDELQLFIDAIKDYNKSIFLNSNDADSYYNRGNAKFDAELYLEAYFDYQKALEINPNDEDYKAQLNQTIEAMKFIE